MEPRPILMVPYIGNDKQSGGRFLNHQPPDQKKAGNNARNKHGLGGSDDEHL